MKVQKSFLDSDPILYIVPTPIGNLNDMTYRGVEVLNQVDYIFSEDTRVTKVLLSHFNIKSKLLSYHSFNEKKQTEVILELLRKRNSIALVSDAGFPTISDPGFYVVSEAIKAGFKVVSLPGATAGITALVASGIPNDKFLFYGFLASKSEQRKKELKSLQDFPETMIFYESPHRIIDSLKDIYEILGNREMALAREITKRYEEYIRGKVLEIINSFSSFKGEVVLIVEGASKTRMQKRLNELDIKAHYNHYLEEGLDSKAAMKRVASDREISKSEVYKVVKIDAT